jgi:hypothetical protein
VSAARPSAAGGEALVADRHTLAEIGSTQARPSRLPCRQSIQPSTAMNRNRPAASSAKPVKAGPDLGA